MTISAPSTAVRVCAGSRRSCSAERMTRESAPSSARRAVTALPRKPAPPVTTAPFPRQNSGEGSDPTLTYSHRATGQLIFECLEVGIAHDLHELFEGHGRLPTELLAGLRRVSAQRVDLRGPEVARVDLDVLLPVDAQVPRRLLEELADRVHLARSDH